MSTCHGHNTEGYRLYSGVSAMSYAFYPRYIAASSSWRWVAGPHAIVTIPRGNRVMSQISRKGRLTAVRPMSRIVSLYTQRYMAAHHHHGGEWRDHMSWSTIPREGGGGVTAHVSVFRLLTACTLLRPPPPPRGGPFWIENTHVRTIGVKSNFFFLFRFGFLKRGKQ